MNQAAKEDKIMSDTEPKSAATLEKYIDDPIVNLTDHPEIKSIKEQLNNLQKNIVPSIENKEDISPKVLPIKSPWSSAIQWISIIAICGILAYGTNVIYDKYTKYNELLEFVSMKYKISKNDLLSELKVFKIPPIITKQIDQIKPVEITKEISKQIENKFPKVEDVVKPVSTSLKWKKIIDVKKYYIIAENTDGSIEKRTGGSHSWRINNPLRISFGKFTEGLGAIGSDGKYAVFPTLVIGQKAAEVLLFETPKAGFSNKNVFDALKKFSTLDDNKAEEYANEILKETKISKDSLMTSLKENERLKLINVIEEAEEFKVGKEYKYKSLDELKEKG